MGRRLNYSESDRSQVYVNMADNFYVIVYNRIRRVILKEIRMSRGAKDRSEQSRAIWLKLRRSDQSVSTRASREDHDQSDQSLSESRTDQSYLGVTIREY